MCVLLIVKVLFTSFSYWSRNLTQLHASFLALSTIFARRVCASVTSFHLSSLLLVTFSIYAYRDIWPLLTFTLSPADAGEGTLLWVKLGLLALAAVLIPLAIPRQYTPVNPKVRLFLLCRPFVF